MTNHPQQQHQDLVELGIPYLWQVIAEENQGELETFARETRFSLTTEDNFKELGIKFERGLRKRRFSFIFIGNNELLNDPNLNLTTHLADLKSLHDEGDVNMEGESFMFFLLIGTLPTNSRHVRQQRPRAHKSEVVARVW